MAGIAGIYCADGRPANMDELRLMTAAVQDRGPDGITWWNSGPVAFAHLQFCTTPESLTERQPLVSPGGEACLTWNGRIDNREELQAALAAKGVQPVDNTDPGYALAAYLAWGEDCVQHMVGDFALALWDARHRRLWCARDYIGIRPFYYFWDGKTFLFGPEMRALLAHPLVSLKINEGMVGEYLVDDITTRDETLYTDIRRLPGGSTLTINASGQFRIASWWNPELSLLHYKSDAEYGDHFRELFDQAVQAQMRSQAKVGVALSGGLDSSSIAVTAQHLLRRTNDTDRLVTFSLVSPGKFWDESEDIAAIVQHSGLNSELLQPLNLGLEHFRKRADDWREFPGVPNGEPMTKPICEAIRRHGGRVLLTGLGGDEWLQGRPEHVLDLARARAIRSTLQRAKDDWSFYCGAGRWQSYLAWQILRAAIPDWAIAQRRKRRLARTGIFSKAFLRRTHLGDRLYAAKLRTLPFSTRAQSTIFSHVTAGHEAFMFEGNDLELVSGGAEMRFPYHDRKVTEFCLRLPEEQRQQGSLAKRVLRTAMGDRLPKPLQRKAVKAEYSDMFATVIYEPQVRARLQSMTMLCHTDWLNAHRFGERSTLSVEPVRSYASNYGRLWMAIAIDLWLETVIGKARL